MVTAALVKELREKTGAGMMDCKRVLTETDGDLEKASELLRERGIAKAAKKSGRVAAEGIVEAYISEDGKVGAIVEVNSETDFVAKNEEFKTFVMDVAKQVVKNNPATVEDLLAEPSISVEGKTVNEVLIDKIATIGENMTVRRFARFETTDGLIEKYIHGDGKIAVLVNMKNGNKELAKDICMQIAAAKPEFVNREQVPAERLEKEKLIVDIVEDGEEGYYYASTNTYDLIILDVMLTNMSGFQILNKLRTDNISSKIIMLTARSTIEDKLNGLENGADDYLTKPFHMDELVARVNIQLKRNGNKNNLSFGDLVLNTTTLKVTCAKTNEVVELIKKEFQLLEYFINNPNQVLSKEQIYDRVWGIENEIESNNLEAYLSFIRRKLKVIESKVVIKSVREIGYKIEYGNKEIK